MHHKKHRPKNRRAGCLCCKPHKMNGVSKDSLQVSKTGFSNLRARLFARSDSDDTKYDYNDDYDEESNQ